MLVELNKSSILSALNEQEEQLRSFGVARIGLFGSFVRGEQHVDSDLDFLVEFKPEKKSFRNFMDLAYYLEDIFGRRVEVVTMEALSPHLGPHIIAETEYAAF